MLTSNNWWESMLHERPRDLLFLMNNVVIDGETNIDPSIVDELLEHFFETQIEPSLRGLSLDSKDVILANAVDIYVENKANIEGQTYLMFLYDNPNIVEEYHDLLSMFYDQIIVNVFKMFHASITLGMVMKNVNLRSDCRRRLCVIDVSFENGVKHE